MKKITFEQWKNHYVDVPFIKENYDLLESMEVPIECILYSQDSWFLPKTKFVRVFTFGSWYEILEDDYVKNEHYILVSDFEYKGTNKGKDFENALRKLYDFVIEKNITKNNLERFEVIDKKSHVITKDNMTSDYYSRPKD